MAKYDYSNFHLDGLIFVFFWIGSNFKMFVHGTTNFFILRGLYPNGFFHTKNMASRKTRTGMEFVSNIYAFPVA